MTLEYYRDHCLAKTSVTEDTPFIGQIHSAFEWEEDFRSARFLNFNTLILNVTRNSGRIEQFPGITPGYHE
jgi:hypothetical protein